jgi:hypothetical protein
MGNQSSSQTTKKVKPITHKDFIQTQQQVKADMIASDLKCLADNSDLLLKRINKIIETEAHKPNRSTDSTEIGKLIITMRPAEISRELIIERIASFLKDFEESEWFFEINHAPHSRELVNIKIENNRYPRNSPRPSKSYHLFYHSKGDRRKLCNTASLISL